MNTFWFWLLIIGVLVILTALLIAGGMKEMHNWTWALFIIGCVLAGLGIIFGLISWYRYTPCVEETVNSCNVTSCNTVFSPISSLSFSSRSSIGSPTRIYTNMPQAKRGFSTTSMSLSSLAPQS